MAKRPRMAKKVKTVSIFELIGKLFGGLALLLILSLTVLGIYHVGRWGVSTTEVKSGSLNESVITETIEVEDIVVETIEGNFKRIEVR